MVSYFMQQSLTPHQHILPSSFEIARVPRVGNIAGVVGVVRSLQSSLRTKGVLCYQRACPITQHCVPTGFVQQAAAQTHYRDKLPQTLPYITGFSPSSRWRPGKKL